MLIPKEKAEIILAETIDTLYLKHKKDFCDHENRTHKLGFFKELVKMKFHENLQETHQAREGRDTDSS